MIEKDYEPLIKERIGENSEKTFTCVNGIFYCLNCKASLEDLFDSLLADPENSSLPIISETNDKELRQQFSKPYIECPECQNTII